MVQFSTYLTQDDFEVIITSDFPHKKAIIISKALKDIFIIFLVYNNVLDEQYKQTGFYTDIDTTLKDFENVVLKDFDNNIEFSYEELNNKLKMNFSMIVVPKMNFINVN